MCRERMIYDRADMSSTEKDRVLFLLSGYDFNNYSNYTII